MKGRIIHLNENEVFFTSDTHFNHAKIIEYCNRPFKDINEMNEKLIENWNSKVTKDSHIFHLGDFCFGGTESWSKVIPRLNGHIHLVLGNHDYQNIRAIKEEMFDSINDIVYLRVLPDNQLIQLCHFPLIIWAAEEKGSWNLYGHYHTTKEHVLLDAKPNQYDVGVDNNNFTPLSYQEVKTIITSRNV